MKQRITERKAAKFEHQKEKVPMKEGQPIPVKGE